jgi:hypothetical protein
MECGMLERQNYLKVKLYLRFTHEVQEQSVTQVCNDFDCLKYLLRWAGLRLLGAASYFSPALYEFLQQDVRRASQQINAERILETSQCFFLWAKAMFPTEFRDIPLSWIMNIKSTPNSKEVIF